MDFEDYGLDYEKDIKIDENALDLEFLDHANKVVQYAQVFADAKSEERRLHDLVKVTRSDLIDAVNNDPEGTTGKAKPNAADIEAYYRRDAKHKRAKEDLNRAVSEAEIAEMIYKAFSYNRKSALENLVSLHNAQYFAGPREPRNIGNEKKKWNDRKEANKNIKISRRKK